MRVALSLSEHILMVKKSTNLTTASVTCSEARTPSEVGGNLSPWPERIWLRINTQDKRWAALSLYTSITHSTRMLTSPDTGNRKAKLKLADHSKLRSPACCCLKIKSKKKKKRKERF
jgi:hypothetical protein